MIIVTTETIPGRKGSSRRSALCAATRCVPGTSARNVLAVLRNIVGGEVHEYAKLISESREQALDRMATEAESLGRQRP